MYSEEGSGARELCINVAKKLGIKPEDIDLTDYEMAERFRNMIRAYVFELEDVVTPFLKKLGLEKESEWAYIQTIKRLELLSGIFQKGDVFNKRANPIKKDLKRCVQQVNTLKKILELENEKKKKAKIGYNLDYKDTFAYRELERCFENCFVNVLKRCFKPNKLPTAFIQSFGGNKNLVIDWYEELFENTTLLPETNLPETNPLTESALGRMREALITMNANHLLYKRQYGVLSNDLG